MGSRVSFMLKIHARRLKKTSMGRPFVYENEEVGQKKEKANPQRLSRWELHNENVVVVQSPSRVFATQKTAERQASLSLTIFWSLPKFMSIALVMLSSHLILLTPPSRTYCPQSFPASGTFPTKDKKKPPYSQANLQSWSSYTKNHLREDSGGTTNSVTQAAA